MPDPATQASRPPGGESQPEGQLLLGCFQIAALVFAGTVLLIVFLFHAAKVARVKAEAEETRRRIAETEDAADRQRQAVLASLELAESAKREAEAKLDARLDSLGNVYAFLARRSSASDPATLQAWYSELAEIPAAELPPWARVRIQDVVLTDVLAGAAPTEVLALALVQWFDRPSASRLVATLAPGRATNRVVLEALLKIHGPREAAARIVPLLDDPEVGELARQVLLHADPAASEVRGAASARQEAADVGYRMLLHKFSLLSSVRNPRDFQRLWETPLTPEQRGELEEVLRRHLQSPGVSVADYVTLAVAWQSERLLRDLVDYVERDIPYLRGERGFWAVQGLAARSRDPRLPALLLQTVDDKLTRPHGEFPDPDLVDRYGSALASVLGGQVEWLTPHLSENSSPGDVARGALFRSGVWPAAAVEEIGSVLTIPGHPAASSVWSLVSDMPPPAEVCDAWLPLVTARIPRTAKGTLEADAGPAAQTATLATARTVERCALAATRMQPGNPAAAQVLALRLFSRFPRETATVLARAAETENALPAPTMASPWLQAFLRQAEAEGREYRPPVLDDPHWSTRIDGGLAALLLGKSGDDVSRGLLRVAGHWGGRATADVLRELSRDPTLAAHHADIAAAVEAIRQRLNRIPAEQGGSRA